MDSVRICFIKNLRRIHDSSDFSRDHVAHELQIDRVTFQYWISGKYFPSTQNIEKLAEIYGVEWLEFFMPECDLEKNEVNQGEDQLLNK
jgi:transcriptional regulator with XRE-family HTH domain